MVAHSSPLNPSNTLELTLILENGITTTVTVTATPRNTYPMISLGYINITPNLWNLNTASSSGYASMVYDASQGALYIHVNFTKVYLNQQVGVAAYSEFIYGYKPWGTLTSEAGGFNFPVKLTELGSLLSFINYSLISYSPQVAIFDWAYDLWLTTSPNLTNGPQPGDVEVMIWLYYHLQQPAGFPVANVTVPIWVNGSLVNETFEVWIGSPQIEPGTHAIVSFRPTNPIPRGLVGVNVTKFLQLAVNYLVTLYPSYWNYTYLESKYLNGIEFGSEWGNPSTYNITLNWVIYKAYLIKVPLESQGTVTVTYTTTVTSTMTVTSILATTSTVTTTSTLTSTVTATSVSTSTVTQTLTTSIVKTVIPVYYTATIIVLLIIIAVVIALAFARRGIRVRLC
ncbi:hypothetical protein [Caldivirga maquilingensis]|nr:hypothetical protein [Caldivirga maquilingensis]